MAKSNEPIYKSMVKKLGHEPGDEAAAKKAMANKAKARAEHKAGAPKDADRKSAPRVKASDAVKKETGIKTPAKGIKSPSKVTEKVTLPKLPKGQITKRPNKLPKGTK